MKKLCSVSFEEVASMENLCEAWQEFIRGKRNKKDVQTFMLRLGDEIADLHTDLLNGDYRHGTYQYFRINDPKPRDIHKAMVRDRLLHHAIHRKLYPVFASLFISDSFSCQTGKGLHRALMRFKNFAGKMSRNNTRTCWVLKCDVRKFFASIDHAILLNILRERVTNQRLLDVLENIIRSFETNPGKGIPLGNLTSQLFSNVYLNEFDGFVKHELKMKYYLRYADDWVFMSRDRSALLDCLPKIMSFLSGSLALSLHPNKVILQTLSSGVDFLGWTHFPHHRVPRTKSKQRMLRCMRHHPKNETLQSYLGMIQHGDAHELHNRLLNDYWFWKD